MLKSSELVELIFVIFNSKIFLQGLKVLQIFL